MTRDGVAMGEQEKGVCTGPREGGGGLGERRHGGRSGTSEGDSNNTRQARAPKVKTSSLANLRHPTHPLHGPQLPSGHRVIPLGFGGGREVEAVQVQSLPTLTISGGSHVSMQPWSWVGKSCLFSLAQQGQEKRDLSWDAPWPLCSPWLRTTPGRISKGPAFHHNAFHLHFPSGERRRSLDTESVLLISLITAPSKVLDYIGWSMHIYRMNKGANKPYQGEGDIRDAETVAQHVCDTSQEPGRILFTNEIGEGGALIHLVCG